MPPRSPVLDYSTANPVTPYYETPEEDFSGIALMTELSTNLLTEDSATLLTD